MRWVSVHTTITSIAKYQLTDGDETRIRLKYNKLQHSVRVCSNNVRRLFFIEHTGFLKTKTIFTNEYGLEVGKLINNSAIECHGKKYYFYFPSSQQVVVFSRQSSQPLFSCELEPGKAQDSDEISALLLGLHCYLYMSTANETQPLSLPLHNN